LRIEWELRNAVDTIANGRHFAAVSFARESTTSVSSDTAGSLLKQARVTTRPQPRGATFVESGAALVYDTAVFGPTSPIIGERYRFAVAA